MSPMYRSPGVTTHEEDLTPSTIQTAPRRLAIAGTGSSTYIVENVEVIRGSGSSDVITGTISTDVSSVVGVGSIPGLYDYKLTTDYTVSNNTIGWSGAVSHPDEGAVYYVTFMKNKGDSFYEPMAFTSQSDVRAIAGSELYNSVINEISLASSLAYINGASEVLTVQQDGLLIQDEEDAIDKLETESLDIICAPGMCSTTLQQYIFAHCNRMSTDTEKKERIYFTSHSNLEASVNDMIGLAISFKNDNVTVIAPPKIEIALTDALCMTDVDVTVSSAYAGAALAGIITNPANDEAEPLTRKQLLGIKSLAGVKYTESEMNKMAANGILVLENVNGIIRVRHALTTATGNINQEELQVKVTRNQTRKDLRTLFERFVGTKYVPNITNSLIASTLKSFCDNKVSDKIYTEYKDISVVQSSTDPRVAQVSYSFKPIYTTTWIDITYSLYF